MMVSVTPFIRRLTCAIADWVWTINTYNALYTIIVGMTTRWSGRRPEAGSETNRRPAGKGVFVCMARLGSVT
jgi:hypothetical protein